ncbi:MAG: TetR/AcrR family transcriptional regulator [Mesorhizobium sp.]|nr:TetR/AcrR family transcriptional regulator [Mesorhizobium sp.]MCO5164524.1 TetR/AcrR family transcriptional regulator [Mesorhizobium sp.]
MSNTPSTPGRPPVLEDAERRLLILKAAEQVFAEMGYGDATMEEVARACGMAKKTIYKHFPDKAALFRALVHSHDVVEAWTQPAGADGPHSDFRETLLGLVSYVLSPRQLTLTRLVISEARKSPDLARFFYRECIDKAQQMAGERLRSVMPDGTAVAQARLMADMVLGATLGQLHLRALILDVDRETLDRDLRERIERVVAIFPHPPD